MLNAWITRRFNGQLRAPRRHGAGHRPAFRPRLEAFEDRVVPATVMWDGGHPTSNRWSEPLNWVGNVAPVAGDDLVFPDNAAQKTNVDNIKFPHFNSLKFTGSGYTVSGGSSNVLNLGAGGILNSARSGTNRYSGPSSWTASARSTCSPATAWR